MAFSWQDFVLTVSVCCIGWIILVTKRKQDMRSQTNKFLRLAKTSTPISTSQTKYFQLAPQSNNPLTQQILNNNIIYFGEQHHNKQILNAQLSLLEFIHSSNVNKSMNTKTAVILEMFNVAQQSRLIDNFMNDKITLSQLQSIYSSDTSQEGFDIENHYSGILSFIKQNSNYFDCIAGFPPRTIAKELVPQIKAMKNINDPNNNNNNRNIDQVLNSIDYKFDFGIKFNIDDNIMNDGLKATIASPFKDANYYKYFYWLITGNMIDILDKSNNDDSWKQFENIFPAQCLKDSIMALKIVECWMTNKYDKIVVISGNGHVAGGLGVHSRVLNWINILNENSNKNENENENGTTKDLSMKKMIIMSDNNGNVELIENDQFLQGLADFVFVSDED